MEKFISKQRKWQNEEKTLAFALREEKIRENEPEMFLKKHLKRLEISVHMNKNVINMKGNNGLRWIVWEEIFDTQYLDQEDMWTYYIWEGKSWTRKRAETQMSLLFNIKKTVICTVPFSTGFSRLRRRIRNI